MNNKSYKLLAIILMLVVSAFVISGCGKSGNRFGNIAPTISITSYEGWTYDSVPANIDTTNHVYSFQQRIFWHATDPDGIIAGYAFRILDENRNPIPSPGYQYISQGDGLTPPELLNTLGEGWVIHYLPSADQSIPLDDPAADRTIWSSQKYAVINFPSADANGNPIQKMSFFEVLAIDNRGAITPVAAWKKFRTTSPRPTCNINTTKGNPNGEAVGSGLKLSFTMQDTDPFITAVPYKFEFKLMKVYDNTDNVVPGSETDWFSTEGQAKIDEYLLTRYTTPPLEYDFVDGVSTTTTRVIARATDMAGVISDVTATSPIEFKVKPGFRPMTLLYSKKLLALGDNHYEDWGDDTTPEVLPFSIIQGQQRYATSLFVNKDNRKTVVHSSNLKVYVRWGWLGEYATVTTAGSTYPEDDPYGKKVDVVLDRATRANYFSEITHFDLRYDDAPYNFPPFAESIQVDGDGKRWLRIPISSPLLQSIVLTGDQVAVGTHKFEVRCVDLQNEYDPTPAVVDFDVVPYTAASSRNGILVVDDDVNNAANSPEDIVNAKYANMLSDYSGTVTYVKYGTDTFADTRSRQLAFADLQKYKMVIYHSDNPGSNGNMDKETDGLALYLVKGGNLLVSHTHRLSGVLNEVSKGGVRVTMLRQMGLPDQPSLPFVSNSLLTYPFFQKANGAMGFPSSNLQFGSGDDASFNPLVNGRHGLSAVAWFPTIAGDAIQTFGCKPVDYASFPPTQDQFNTYNGKTVGMRYTNTTGGKVYLFGYPLSYMKDADTKAMMNKILSELM